MNGCGEIRVSTQDGLLSVLLAHALPVSTMFGKHELYHNSPTAIQNAGLQDVVGGHNVRVEVEPSQVEVSILAKVG